MNDLPESWAECYLEQIANINPRLPFKNICDETNVSFIPMKAVKEESGKFDLDETRKYVEVKRGYTSFIDNDIIFAKITPCMENGKIAVVSNLQNGLGFGSTEFHVIRLLDPKFLSKYLFYFLVQKKIRNEARIHMAGTSGHLRVTADYMKSLLIPVPPLNEQKRIVAKLEKLLTEVESAQARLEKIPQIIKRFRQSVLMQAVTGELTKDWREQNPDVESAEHLLNSLQVRDYERIEESSWAKCKISSIYKSFGGGTPCKSNPKFWNGNIPWISSGEVKNDEISEGTYYITEEGLNSSSAKICPINSIIVVVRSGILKHTLPVSIVKRPLTVNQDIKCFDAGSEYLNKWLHLYLKANAQNILSLNREGTTVQSVKYETLNNFEINIPSLREQQEIIRRVQDLLEKADKIEEHYNKAKSYTDKLTQSILNKAFKGELVPQDPNDEPASVLLKRIQAAKKHQ